MTIFKKNTSFCTSSGALSAFHFKPGAFERLNPPWEPVSVISHSGTVADGSEVAIDVPVAPLISQTWKIRHENVVPGKQFQDRMIKGPFRSWIHTHSFNALSAATSELVDHIDYTLPFGISLGESFVERKLSRVFNYRHQVTKQSLQDFGDILEGKKSPLTIVISGASGMIGSALAAYLSSGGHRVKILARSLPQYCPYEVSLWHPKKEIIDTLFLEKVDAVIHLSGSSVAESRWTPAIKQELHDSRINSTKFLVDTLCKLNNPPSTLIVASAIGYYGACPSLPVDESSPKGSGFLADLVEAWEKAADPARDAGIRVVHPRFGVVLDPRGGILKKVLPIFKSGLGGPIGDGTQHMSWIGLEDAVRGIGFLLNSSVAGPVNFTSPHSVTNEEFSRALGKVLSRPHFFRVPEFAIKAAFGEMGEETVLSSQVVKSTVLLDPNFFFVESKVEGQLLNCLGYI